MPHPIYRIFISSTFLDLAPERKAVEQAVEDLNSAVASRSRSCCRSKPTRDALHAYLGGVSKQLDCPPFLVGGVEDHVHLLARFGRTVTQAEWVKELKRVSNLWLKERGRDYADFEWQGGYADYSVSQSKLPDVKEYIAGQEEHHRKMRFQDELGALLRKHEIEWDEKYVWD
jgi:putative transposase